MSARGMHMNCFLIRVEEIFATAGRFADSKAACASLRTIWFCASTKRRRELQCLHENICVLVSITPRDRYLLQLRFFQTAKRLALTTSQRVVVPAQLASGLQHCRTDVYGMKGIVISTKRYINTYIEAKETAHFYKLPRRNRWYMAANYCRCRYDRCKSS
jgi:hypothetical protein